MKSVWHPCRLRILLAPLAVLIIAAVLTAPYCGQIFACGCTWPWDGLSAHCNFYDQNSALRCPWCQHPIAGASSIFIAMLPGFLAAMWQKDQRVRLLPRVRSSVPEIILRIAGGVAVFILVAAAAGWLTAALSGYPNFVYW